MTPEPYAYELWGVTDEGRETILSYNEDDAGNIEMRISRVYPLYAPEIIQKVLEEKLEEVEKFGHDECACTKAEKVIERTAAEFKQKSGDSGE